MRTFLNVALIASLFLSTGCTLHSSNKLSISVVVPGPPPRQVGFESASGTPWRAMSRPPARSTVVNGCFFANVLTADQKRTIDANGGNCWQRGELSAPKVRPTADSFVIQMEATGGSNRLVEVLRLTRPDGSDDDCTGTVESRLAAGAIVQSYGYGSGDFLLGSSVDVYPSSSPQTVTENCAINGSSATTYPVLFVVDQGHRLLRTISATSVGTIAGDGTSGSTVVADGLAATAGPLGIVSHVTQDSDGNIYFNEELSGAHGVRKIDTNGIVSTLLGVTDSITIAGVATDGTLVYYSQTDCVRSISVNGGATNLVQGNCGSPFNTYPGSEPLGSPSGATFYVTSVDGIAYANGSLYLADRGDGLVTRIDLSGHSTHIVAGKNNETGSFDADGNAGGSTRLSQPNAVAVDSSGAVYFTDSGQSRVRKADSTSSHIVTTLDSTDALNAQGVAVAPDGTVYYSETPSFLVRVVDSQGNKSIFAGVDNIPNPPNDGSSLTNAHFHYPVGLFYGFLKF